MVYQSDVSDCGKTVVRNLLSLLFKDDVFDTQPLIEKCDNLLSIRKELERNDVKYTSYEVDNIQAVKKEQYPLVALVKNDDVNHFIIIEKLKGNKVYVLDPQFGRYVLSVDEFQQIFLHKMLLLDSFLGKPVAKKIDFLTNKEKMSYAFCFVFEIIAFVCFILSTGFENYFIYSIISFIVLLVMLVLQNALNFMTQSRIEKDIIHPYMMSSKHKEDFIHLNHITSAIIKRYSNMVSYALLLVSMMMLLCLNSYFLSFLVFIPFIFNLVRISLVKVKNKALRNCSIEENRYLKNLKTDEFNSFSHYANAKKKGYSFIAYDLLTYLLEYSFILIFLIFELYMLDKMNINLIAYYFCLMTSISYSMKKLYELYINREKEKVEINALSIPLGFFLFKCQVDLKYNNGDKGVLYANEKQPSSRICESVQQEQIFEEAVSARLPSHAQSSQERGEISCVTRSREQR